MKTEIQSPKILLCENDQEVREAIAFMLEINLKARVTQCASGPESIKNLESNKFDLVISDYELGQSGETGLDVFYYLLNQGITCPFFLLTASFQSFKSLAAYPTFKWFSKSDLKSLNQELSQVFYAP